MSGGDYTTKGLEARVEVGLAMALRTHLPQNEHEVQKGRRNKRGLDRKRILVLVQKRPVIPELVILIFGGIHN